MNKIKILLLDEAKQFMMQCPKSAGIKILRVFDRVEAGLIDASLFKKIKGTDIWEFRVEYESNAYRLLAFYDKKTKSLIVATHGFVKKSQKTPQKEIEKAERIMKEYYKK
ncbi:MAG: type II toxin-antitoxin system RelE/ParE family toxin [Bacteroidales bacterium]|nr:type II toxin-antitoxin system RelE/ParE family toxin [Bacteroidales bacterium]